MRRSREDFNDALNILIAERYDVGPIELHMLVNIVFVAYVNSLDW